jgi:hypothetical protein
MLAMGRPVSNQNKISVNILTVYGLDDLDLISGMVQRFFFSSDCLRGPTHPYAPECHIDMCQQLGV